MRGISLLPAMLLLAGCSGESATQTASGEKTLETGDLENAPISPPRIQGAYRVAGVNGEDVNMGWAMTATIDEDTVELVSQCIAARWSYRWQGNALVTEAIPEPVCDRGRLPAEEGAIAALDAANSARWTPQNGLFINGPGGSLTLFSQ